MDAGSTGAAAASASMIVRLLLITLVLAGAYALRLVADYAPALNPDRRLDGVDADWRVPLNAALYHPGLYAYQRGYAHLRAYYPGAATDPDPFASGLARAEAARDMFERGLSVAPADTFLWSGLAWAEATTGEMEAARAALEKSFAAAPYSAALAAERVMLADLLDEAEEIELATWARRDLVCANMALRGRGIAMAPSDLASLAPEAAALCAPQH